MQYTCQNHLRVLVALEDVQLVKNQERIQGHKDNDGQQRKRRKLDCGKLIRLVAKIRDAVSANWTEVVHVPHV